MARLDLNALTLWITAAAIQHPQSLADHVAQRLDVTRRTACKALSRLVELQWLERGGTRCRPTYKPGLLRQVVHRYPLQGLQEHVPWSRDFAPFFALPAHVQRLAQHAFCELVNNAVDHSEGTGVTVSMRQTPSQVQLLVSDDGRGLFDKLRETFALDDQSLAMLELSKGRLTSQPERHTGRGLFFTARIADVVDVHANASGFQRRGWQGGAWHPGRALKQQGTLVYVAIALDTRRTLESVLQAHSIDGSGAALDCTTVPLALATSAHTGLESRAQARCVVERLSQFRRAEIDFAGVESIGHAFADELFRVMAGRDPDLELVPVNMTAPVARLVQSVRR
jgi:anti-sigma regulatory factor (Ser/Thr protein kinase)